MKNLLLLFAVSTLLSPLSVFADWTYDQSSNKITDGNWIFNVSRNGTWLSIASLASVNDATSLDLSMPVKSSSGTTSYQIEKIDASVFFKSATARANLKTVVLPNTIKRIETQAFSNCTALESITPFFPDSLTYVGAYAFVGCSSLTGNVVFAGSSISFGEHNNYGNFEKCAIDSLEITANCSKIPNRAFYHCANLKRVKVPDTLTSIGVNAFAGCTSMESFTPLLPSSLVNLWGCAFYNTPALTNDLVFRNTSAITIEGSSQWGHFEGSGIKSITFDSPITTYNNYMFENCKSVGKIVFPEVTIAKINNYAFNGLSALTNVVFRGNPPTSVDGEAFKNSGSAVIALTPIGNAAWETLINGLSAMTDAQKATFQSVYPNDVLPKGIWSRGGHNFYVYDRPYSSKTDFLEVTSEFPIGNPSPAYGATNFTESIVCSIDEKAEYEGVEYQCAGWKTEVEESDYNYVALQSGEGNTFTLSPDAQRRNVRLTWLWELSGFTVGTAVFGNDSNGSVTVSPLKELYADGDVITITATPAEGKEFLAWTGDIDEANRYNPVLTITVSEAISLSAVFSGDWTYDPATSRLSDGNWIISASLDSQGMLALASFVDAGVPDLLDLSRPVYSLDGQSAYQIASIGQSCFYGTDHAKCKEGLLEVRLPETLTTINNQAFASCFNLAKVTPFLPDSVSEIGAYAFHYCYELAGDLVLSNPELAIQSNESWGNFEKTKINSVTITSPLTVIPARMFERCENMKWAKIPETTQRIGNRAFNNCTSMESLTPLFPSNVTSVGKVSFYNCCSLTGDVVFAGNTLLIEEVNSYGTFENAKFTSVDFQTELGKLPERAFFHCYDLKTVRFRDTLSGIGINAFSGCTNLVSVTPFLPKNLTYLGGTAFYKTHALSGDLVFHSPDLEIEGGSEYGHFYMSNIRSVTFEHEIERINNRMFNSCTNLSCLVFSGAAPTQIGEASFEGMSDYLPRVYVPDDDSLWQTVPLGTLTAWSDLTDEEQQYYFGNYPSGALPFAMWTVSDSLHMWLLRARENGLLMFLR